MMNLLVQYKKWLKLCQYNYKNTFYSEYDLQIY
jgi:hypothetical protein